MKELSIGEKAKRYDEAIERAKNHYSTTDSSSDIKLIGLIFPELKESEDEKIRQALIRFHKSTIDVDGIKGDEIVSWLEKQGEKKSIDDLTQQEAMDIAVDKCFEQGEQKPTDKVEPKFKIGDLITNGILVGEIDEIHELGYHAYFGDHYADVPDIENWHKWTIQDAKDGDVLIDKSNGRESPFIFKTTKLSDIKTDILNPLTVLGYCGIGGAGFTKGNGWGDTANCIYYPASKEQHDLLFQKIKEAGYEWDSEKKELKKVEQKKELTVFEFSLKHIIEEAIECGDIHNLKADADLLLRIAQKTSWSEEDNRMCKAIIDNIQAICEEGYFVGNIDSDELIKWLKSIKDRVQPQNGYNPYKEVVESIAEMCKHYDKASHSGLRDFYDNVKVKCKDAKEYVSLYPQTTWKPSDEQMIAISTAIGVLGKGTINGKYLIELQEQLKKLMKE